MEWTKRINLFRPGFVYSVFKMRTALLTTVVFLLGFAAMFGQAPEPQPLTSQARLTFEVASIKAFEMPAAGGGRGVFFGRGGGPGTKDPGRVNWSGATLHDLMANAYDVKRYQVTGPAWIDTERYDIVAKVPEGATKEQVRVMWQNLLADRFGVVFRREQKEFTVEELTAAKGGPKLKPTDLDPNAAQPAQPALPDGPPKLDSNGFPQLNGPGLIVMVSGGRGGAPVGHLVARAKSIQDLTDFLGMEMNKPVVDKTGLTGRYDFTLEYTPDLAGRGLLPPPGDVGRPPGGTGAVGDAAEPGTNLGAAVQQLGLRLTSGKAKLDVLVIEKAEKTPTEN